MHDNTRKMLMQCHYISAHTHTRAAHGLTSFRQFDFGIRTSHRLISARRRGRRGLTDSNEDLEDHCFLFRMENEKNIPISILIFDSCSARCYHWHRNKSLNELSLPRHTHTYTYLPEKKLSDFKNIERNDCNGAHKME